MYKPEKVILYVKPVCGWCRQAEHWLKSQGIEFETVDVMEDPAAFEHMEKILSLIHISEPTRPY